MDSCERGFPVVKGHSVVKAFLAVGKSKVFPCGKHPPPIQRVLSSGSDFSLVFPSSPPRLQNCFCLCSDRTLNQAAAGLSRCGIAHGTAQKRRRDGSACP